MVGEATQFGEGNEVALKHGALSARCVSPIAETIAATIPDVAPWAATPTFAGTCQSLAWTEAQAQLVREYLDEVGLLDDEGKPRPATALLTQLERRAASLRTELGLSPLAMVRILAGLSNVDAARSIDGLDALKQAGRQIVAAREQQAAAELGAAEDRAEENA